MDEICVAKFDVYECRKSDRASALSGAQLNICAAQTPEFPDTIPTIDMPIPAICRVGPRTPERIKALVGYERTKRSHALDDIKWT